MSGSHEEKSFIERYWQVFVIGYVIVIAVFIGQLGPH